VKRFVKNLLRRHGYVIRRKDFLPQTLNPFEQQQLLLARCENPMVLDVGAYHGGVTTIYRGLFPSATIHSFEPFPQSFEMLRKVAASDPSVFAHQMAISDEHGPTTFYVHASTPANSLLRADSRAKPYWSRAASDTKDEIEVQSTTLDAFCQENNINRIDILKLDVQGGELRALEGAIGLLHRGAISLIYAEVIIIPAYEGQPPFHAMCGFLHDRGFELFNVYNLRYRKSRLAHMDVLFIGGGLGERRAP
jgi:FkbM family methyltransferase